MHKTRVFATNFVVGGLHASYERHFVKKIQHLFLFNASYFQDYEHSFGGVRCGENIIHQWKNCSSQFFSYKPYLLLNREVQVCPYI